MEVGFDSEHPVVLEEMIVMMLLYKWKMMKRLK